MHRLAQSRRTVSGGIALVVAAGFVLSGCSAPTTTDFGQGAEPVVISIDANSAEQVVLAEFYRQELEDINHSTQVISPAADSETGSETSKVERLRSTEANFVIGCTGDLLAELNPTETGVLVTEVNTAEQSGDTSFNVSQRTYDEFVGSLPGDVQTTDPSPAQGCADTQHSELAQNLVPVFSKGLFDRSEQRSINAWTRGLVTDELKEVADEVKRGETVENAVLNWRSTHNSNINQAEDSSQKN
ncbi:hypothetical protein ACXZ66_05910 [Corynebacterium sp. S7]